MGEVVQYLKSHKELVVYQRAYAVSLLMHRLSLKFPKDELYGLTSQLRRASKSICANIAEGFAKQSDSKPEFRRFLTVAVGSAREVGVWLDYCLDLGYIDAATHRKLTLEYDGIIEMLYKLKSKNND